MAILSGMISAMRRITSTIAVAMSVVVAVLFAGCGGSSSAATGSQADGSAATISGAEALTYAHVVNLRAGDVPGTTSKRYVEVVKYQHKRGAFPNCTGLPAGRLLMKVQSPIFGSAYWWMRSTVAVMSNEAFAAAYVSALDSSRGHRCLLPRTPPIKVSFSTLQVAPPAVGVRIGEMVGTRVERSHRDFFAFAAGRSVVTLIAEGEKTPSLVAEQHILSLLYSRAEAHKLS